MRALTSDDTAVFLSLGAGVQSSTVALMAARGEFETMPEAAIFADTQAEPPHVYDWLDWLETQLPFPVHRVTAGNLEDTFSKMRTHQDSGLPYWSSAVPMYADRGDSLGIMPRRCTREYKIEPIQRKVRELLDDRYTPGKICAQQWIGISLDEIQRMSASRVKYVENVFPLVERRMTRLHCLEWLRDNGYNELPRKSSCYFCPYHDNAEWRAIRNEYPELWHRAAELERTANEYASKTEHRNAKLDSRLYLHQERIPLHDVCLDDPPDGQGRFSFMDECEGMCGL